MRNYMIFVILLMFTGCATQQKTIKKEVNMRKFNIDLFEKNKNNDNYYDYVTTDQNGDSLQIRLADEEQYYQENIKVLNTPFEKVYQYSKLTYNVIFEVETFYNCVIGVRKRYNNQGELIKETDFDAGFNFSWLDLVKMLKEKYDIDLMDIKGQIERNKRISVGRSNLEEHPKSYTVMIPIRWDVKGVHYGLLKRPILISSDGEVFFLTNDDGKILIDNREEFKKGKLGKKKGAWSTLFD